MKIYILFCCAVLIAPAAVLACDTCKVSQPSPGQRVVEYDLRIVERQLSPAGKKVRVLAINGGIPGPTLHFREGDFARIRVHNDLPNEETSTHWHGILLPNPQDGVPHVTTPPILPGTTHTFNFTLRHSGTYWYHSHTHLQEQSGVYGAIVVTPRGGERVKADREDALVLSDWTNIDPHEVQRMLMRGTDYFALKRGNAQSLLGAAQKGMLKPYIQSQWDRMMPMDLSDVGYDAFLVNGQRSIRTAGKPGERLRLRIVNAASATNFYLHSSAGPMTIVAADGPPVEPVKLDRFLVAVAETYDVIVTVPPNGQYELRATAQDGSGHASALFGVGKLHPAADPPKPNVYDMDEMLNLALEEKEDDPRASLVLPRPGSPYRLLRAPESTALPAKLPRRKITLHLTGDMNRYIWSFDGKTIAEAPYVMLKRGEVIELELVNDTMMHHPIHLHGHFFRLLMGQGARSPLKHTVDVPPMTSRTVEFEANEAHDWLFHCHILYHMMSGMGRVFRYEDEAKPSLPQPASSPHVGGLGEHEHDLSYVWGAASLQSNMSEGLLTWMNPKNDLQLAWEVGWQGVDDPQYEIDAIYQRYFNPNFQAFIGGRFTNDEDAQDRAIAGINYRLPLMVWANLSLDSEGDARLTLAKRIQLTSRLGIFGEVFYDTGTEWEWSAGADYTLTRRASLTASYHSDYGLGAGVLIRF